MVIASAAMAAPVGAAPAHGRSAAAPPVEQLTPLSQLTSPPPQTGTGRPSSEADDIVQVVGGALSGIDLRPDQTDALQKVGADLDAKVGAVGEAKRTLLSGIATQIGSGKVDADALHTQVEAVVAAAQAASPAVRSSLEKVHDILDPSQRLQFVDGFRGVMRQLATDADPKARLDEWAKTLSLTDDQKSKLGATAQDAAADVEARARVEHVLAAFPADRFAMNEVLPESDVGARTEKMLARMNHAADRVAAILTPGQRDIAARALRHEIAGQANPAMHKPSGAPSGIALVVPEEVADAAEALWAGPRASVSYRRSSGFAFSGGFGAGYGGFYLL
jgi:Spy/CpxP family protein refolding chaperone